jgi:hypothetical protein
VREEAAANLLRDDASEAEVCIRSPWLWRSRRKAIAVVDHR